MLTVISVLAQANTGQSSTNPAQTALTGSDKGWTLAVVVGFVLLAGVVLIVGRRWLEGASAPADQAGTASTQSARDTTVVRSWLAISLVGGLLIFVALSFWLNDQTLRSTLIGGVIANAGAAVAFYFASKSSDQARRDILAASLPATVVPNLVGKPVNKVQEAIAATSLRLELRPPAPNAGAQVVMQTPAAGDPAGTGSTVVATFAGPVPDLSGKTLAQAQAALAAVGLELVPEPSAPAATDVVKSQAPVAGGDVPTTSKVGATFGP